jgi:hypothetical protein
MQMQQFICTDSVLGVLLVLEVLQRQRSHRLCFSRSIYCILHVSKFES